VTNVDDVTAASLLHQWNSFVAAVKNTTQVRFDYGAEVFRSGRRYRREESNSGVVNEDVNATYLVKHCPHLIVIANVAEITGCGARTRDVQFRDCIRDAVFATRRDRNP
jgi:hypothetical protein